MSRENNSHKFYNLWQERVKCHIECASSLLDGSKINRAENINLLRKAGDKLGTAKGFLAYLFQINLIYAGYGKGDKSIWVN